MKLKGIRIAVLLLALCIMAVMASACGEEPVTLTVIDKNTSTDVEADVGMTVAQVLESISVKVGDKDEVAPALDSTITSASKEITVKRYASVTVKLADEEKTVELVGGKVEDAIKEAGFALDEVEADADVNAYLDDSMVITLTKETAVTLTADGETKELSTKTNTVDEFLKENEITLGEFDEVSEKLDSKLENGMKIVIKRVEYKEETKKESIKFKTEEKYSDAMQTGTSEVTQKGEKGEKTVTYKVKYVDGKEESREKVSEKVTKQPVNKIITYGSGSAPVTSEEPLGDGIKSKTPVYDCDGSGHGYYIIEYYDGRVEYEVF